MTARLFSQPDAVKRLAERLTKLATQVASFWGLGLPVSVGESTAFHWTQVTVGEELVNESDEALVCLLLHEWGHRTLAPVSIAQAFWWEILARLEGIRAAGEAANLATDLIVDGWYLRHPRWASIYAAEEARNVETLLANSRDDQGTIADPVIRLSLACYAVMGGWGRDDPALSDDLPLAERALQALRRPDAAPDQQMRGFFRIVAPVFARRDRARCPSQETCRGAGGPSTPSSPLGGRAQPWRGPTWNAQDLVRILASQGHRVPEGTLEAVCGKGVARQVRARLRVLDSLVRVEPKVREIARRFQKSREEGATLWRPGESLRHLEPLMSLDRSARLLPGVTTLKRYHGQGRPKGPGLDHLCLVVDDSGSTQGAILDGELDAAVALLEMSRRLQIDASLVVFGSEVTAALEPSRAYDRISTLLASLSGGSGGTCLAPALRQVQVFAQPPPLSTATVVFSDSWIFDEEPSVKLLDALGTLGPVVLFLVERSLDSDFLSAIAQMESPPRVVKHSPGAPLTDEALQIFEEAEVRAFGASGGPPTRGLF